MRYCTMKKQLLTAAVLVTMASLLLAACSSTKSTAKAATQKATLTVAVFNPFSGPKATYGPMMMAGCIPAVRLINADGGVLGHKLNCLPVDTRGDPADAVPAADKLIATEGSRLLMVLGPSTVEALSTGPIFNAAKVPFFPDAGVAQWDRTSYKYLWRLIPPDAGDGFAQAEWAHEKGYTRAAAIYASVVSTTGTPAGVKAGFPALGGKIVFSATLTPAQPTYETVITSMLAAHPQVIFYDAGPRTSATFFSELKALGGLMPVIGPEVILEPAWVTAVNGVLGASTTSKYISIVETYVDTHAAGYPTFKSALLGSSSQVPNASTYIDDPFVIANYNAINMMALAMLQTHSTNRVVANKDLMSIITPKPGAVVVNSFAAGKKAILAGKKIQYVGAGGPIVLNRYHNTAGGYRVVTDSLTPTTLGQVSQSAVTHLLSRASSAR